MNAASLRADALACTLGHRTLFERLDFALDSGQWLMLTGANGTGKSTLLRVVAGLVRPSAGTVLWRGQARRVGDPAWNASFCYQGHASGWKDLLSAHENLRMQLALDCVAADRCGAPDLETRVSAALERVGLERQRNLQHLRLSAGQRRRLGLARLAASERALWLLDEPTTALDAQGEQLFARLLDEHLARGGCAVVATHHPVPTGAPARSLRLGDDA
ncbi:MAG: cytochrome c biogenesis heme-transporting ATPase CcmA [Burkholderiaceae bacterium]|nr:cytochrome c biogenesis heme-transporting ATPase CcmA [Burkholderiaceae bacterium]